MSLTVTATKALASPPNERLVSQTIGHDQFGPSPTPAASQRTAAQTDPGFCWADLTSDERRECAGKQWKNRRCGRFAWDVKGRLRDIYESDIEPVISTLWRLNYSYIHRVKSADYLSGQACLLGPIEHDVTHAAPFVFVICENSKKGQRAKKVIQDSARFRANSVGFDVAYDRHHIVHISGIAVDLSSLSRDQLPLMGNLPSSPDTTHMPSDRDLIHSPCGSKLSLSINSSANTLGSITTTLGGVLLVSDRYYALTALHPLLTDYERNSRANIEGEARNTQCDEAGDEDEGDLENVSLLPIDLDDDDGSTTLEEPQETDLFQLSSIGIVRAYYDGPVANDSDPIMIGSIKPSVSYPEGIVPSKHVSLNFDYALIEIHDPRFMRRNEIALSEKSSIVVHKTNLNHQRPSDTIIVAAGVSGILETTISGTISNLLLPWLNKSLRVLTIGKSLEKGDSGAWVVDCHGTLYGMVIATVPSLDISYIVRAEDLFSSILHGAKDNIDINSILPANISASTEIYRSPQFDVSSLAGSRALTFGSSAASVIDSPASVADSVTSNYHRPNYKSQYKLSESPWDSPSGDQFLQSNYLFQQPYSVQHTKPRSVCLWPGCLGSFTRTADLARHYRIVHNHELIDCPHPRCHHKGDYGFARKDRLMEHRRKDHMEDHSQ